MTWIEKHKRIWRISILVLMVVSLLGPWAFDLINVPAKYTCTPPNIRLWGDFCGLPLPGVQVLAWITSGVLNMVAGIFTGDLSLSHRGFEFLLSLLYSLLTLLLILPIFNTLRFLLRGERKCQQVCHILVSGLNLGVGLLLGLSNYPQLFYALWGLWLYILMTVSTLILEILTLTAGRRLGQG
jgi:hypothetical protein